ncbi:CTP synthase [Pseudomonas syringae pv. actinidiae]|nr:CTP synthase [Pseudomonas syringae pv. actinidiae]
MELQGHPFFVATLFQSERAALLGTIPPVVDAFMRACIASAAGDAS